MRINKTKIEGAYLITRLPFCDERGQFARMFCEDELKKAGISFNAVQVSFSENIQIGIIRGLHSQTGEYAEDKLVSCISGKIYDVCVDVRVDSPTYGQFVSAELSDENGNMLLVPKGCAHGYLTLTANTKMIYIMSNFYNGSAEKGYRYDDSFFNINWSDYFPPPYILSEKDKNHELIGTG